MVKLNYRYIILLILSFMFAYSQGGAIGYTVFYIFLLIGLVSVFFSIVSLFSVKLQAEVNQRSYVSGSSEIIKYTIKNKSFIFVPYFIHQADMLKALLKDYNGEIISLRPREEATLKYKISFPTRGIYNLGSCRIATRDILGVIDIEGSMDLKYSIKVYPKIYPLERFLFGGRDHFEVIKRAPSSIEDSYNIRDIRKYREGDSIKRINWKVSAKKQELYIKNLESVSGEEFYLILDMHRKNYSIDPKGLKEELMIDFTVSLIKILLNKTVTVRLSINNEHRVDFFLEGENDYRGLMEYLVAEKSKATDSLIKLLHERADSYQAIRGLAIVTATATEELMNYCLNLRAKNTSIMLFLAEENESFLASKERLEAYGIFCYNIMELIAVYSGEDFDKSFGVNR